MIVNPPCECAPILSVFVAVCKPWDDDTGRCTRKSVGIPPIPDVACKVGLIRCATVALFVGTLLLVAEAVYHA